MVLALLQRLREGQPAPPTLLLDDPAAELDAHRLALLVETVTDLNCQLIITSLDPQLRLFGQPERVFHVEQGSVQQIR
jgi:DNA replication and repair protein RecF